MMAILILDLKFGNSHILNRLYHFRDYMVHNCAVIYKTNSGTLRLLIKLRKPKPLIGLNPQGPKLS